MKVRLFAVLIVVMLVTMGCGLTSAPMMAQPTYTPYPTQIPPTAYPTQAPPTAIPPTVVPQIDETAYTSKIIMWSTQLYDELNTLSVVFTNASESDFSSTYWVNDVYAKYDSIIELARKVGQEPCPDSYKQAIVYWNMGYDELVAGRADMHRGFDNQDVDALSAFATHLTNAGDYIGKSAEAMP